MSKKIILAFDFDGVIIDTAYESYLISARTYNEITGKNSISKKNADQYAKGRAFSLNAQTNYTLIKMIDENPKLDFSTLSQAEFDKNVTENKEVAIIFEENFFQTRKRMAQTSEWFKIQSPFEGIVSLLNKMSKKYSTYIVTTKARETVLALLNYHKINFPEEKVITKLHVETKDILLKEVAEKENVLISQVVLIDDALKQLVNAKEAGVKTILAMWGEKRELFEKEAKKQNIPIAYSPKDCEKIILNID